MAEEAIFINYEDTIILKKALAKSLYKRNIDQLKISEILHLSQPMVSNYLSSKEKIPNNIEKLAENLARKIITEGIPDFYTCVIFDSTSIEGKFYVAEKSELINKEKNDIIDNLTEAFLILKGKDFSGLIPEVKINIAMTKDDAKNSDDVAAFLNGLIIADDRPASNNGIRFGKSKHLSSLLLYLKKNLAVNAIMNIAYVEHLKKTGFNYGYLTKDFKLKEKNNHFDILFHEGDFGIEPCAYIIGKNAVEVANKVIKIKEGIK